MPNRRDTDGDLMPDGYEVDNDHNPLVSDGADDSNSNGTSNYDEYIASQPDADGDGAPDDWEVAHGFDPNDPSDGEMDPDGDHLTNAQEFLAGTDPNNGTEGYQELPFQVLYPEQLNDLGQVVGVSGPGKIAVWQCGNLTTYDVPSGAEALAINNSGTIVGFIPEGNLQRPFVIHQGNLVQLSVTFDESYHDGYRLLGVTNSGFVYGVHRAADGSRSAFRWKSGILTDLSAPRDANGEIPVIASGRQAGEKGIGIGKSVWFGINAANELGHLSVIATMSDTRFAHYVYRLSLIHI